MDSKVINYRGAIESQIKEGNLKEAMETIDTLNRHVFELGRSSVKEDPDNDQVNHPSHYQSFNKELNIECIDAMRAAFGDEAVTNFCICNAFKYVWRHQSKNGKQDIFKAVWYLNKYLELNK